VRGEVTPFFRGEEHAQAKLTEGDVIEVRAACEAGSTQVLLAAQYGVCYQLIGMVVRREVWRHI